MKKMILSLFIMLSLSQPAFATKNCFLAKENNQIIKNEGDCESRHAPCSTFKIAISLMSYNEGLLIDETHPDLPFKQGYADWLDKWKQSHNPSLWMKNSCVWYSQVLTQKLGMDKFSEYIKKFDYGNQDVSGDKGKNNGITNAWLSSSLEISPQEQTIFLYKLLNNKLPVSAQSHAMTRKILFLEELPDGWKLYGKTGSGSKLNKDRTKKLDLQIGWFIGWIQKNNRTIIFANYIEDTDKHDTYASLRAKAAAKEKLLQLVQNLP
jgi:beta-lactamase class D